MGDSNFSDLSKLITKSLTKDEKKKDGIFFTPKSIRNKFIDKIKTLLDANKSYDIVEPSCGSCEFIDDILDSGIMINKVVGVEKNKKIYKYLEERYERKDEIELRNEDFLEYKDKGDLFVGNPPYFVITKKNVPKIYEKYFEGRPNIFTLFMIHSLHLLNDKGLICYVIPTSFLNSKYYNLTREYIYNNFIIRDIIIFDENDFIDTEQTTLGIIIQKDDTITNKKVINDMYVKMFSNNIIFFDIEIKKKIDNILQNSTTLKQLGATVKTGTIVWNEWKEQLVDDNKKKILVYNSNIVNNKFELKEFKNDEKKQYINTNEYQEGPIIVVNRGNGNAKYNFTYCYLDKKIKNNYYLVENHLNMIIGKEDILKKAMKSFEDKRTKEFLKLFCGNNGLSKTEIETILPIYI
jgi:adenine-specific DNA-methyltransferase